MIELCFLVTNQAKPIIGHRLCTRKHDRSQCAVTLQSPSYSFAATRYSAYIEAEADRAGYPELV